MTVLKRMSEGQEITTITMRRGDDKRFELTVTDKQTGNAVDITGCTIALTLRETLTGAVFHSYDFTLTDPTNGLAEVTIPSADTASLTNTKHEYYFDVQITKTDAALETLIFGEFIVLPDVTYT